MDNTQKIVKEIKHLEEEHKIGLSYLLQLQDKISYTAGYQVAKKLNYIKIFLQSLWIGSIAIFIFGYFSIGIFEGIFLSAGLSTFIIYALENTEKSIQKYLYEKKLKNKNLETYIKKMDK